MIQLVFHYLLQRTVNERVAIRLYFMVIAGDIGVIMRFGSPLTSVIISLFYQTAQQYE